MSRIVVLDGYAANPGDLSWEAFEVLGDLEVHDKTDPAELLDRIGEAEYILVNKTVISRETMEACPRLKYIGILATGYNVVDLDAASEHGITVCNVPAYSTNAVAQLVFAHILEICHRVGSHNDAVKAGQWTESPHFAFWNHPLIELQGKTLGIIGYGDIGRRVAEIAVAMGMEVLASRRSPRPEDNRDHIRMAELPEILAAADIISLHAPLTEETRGIVNRDTIKQMKDGVILINTARGPLVNEADLAEALHSGKVYAAGIDVVSVEPVRADNPLLACENAFITPHIAWAPLEARTRLFKIASDNIRAYMAGEPQNVVNRPRA